MVPEVPVCPQTSASSTEGRRLGRLGQLELLLEDVWRGDQEVSERVRQSPAK